MNDVWSFTASNAVPAFLPQGSWQQQGASSALPARMGLAGSSATQIVTSVGGNAKQKDSSKTVVYLYGGIGSTGTYLDDIYLYDTAPSTNAPAWTQIRQLSSARTSSTLQSPHIVQPSARALMSWQAMALPYSLLVGLSRTTLSTLNLLDFLSATSGTTATETVFVAYGGRSDPPNNFSTTWSTAAQPQTFINSTSVLNTDYADLWWYIASADTWVRVGNLTCLDNTYTCSDYKYMNDVVAAAEAGEGVSLNDQVASIQGNFTLPLRPDSLSAEVMALYSLVSSLNDTLYDTLSFLMSAGSAYETDVPNACAQSCTSFIETPYPPLASPTNCLLGNPSINNNCPFYFATRTQLGITIVAQRPNATEGYGSGVYVGSKVNASFSIYYQFGGFSCGQGQGDNLFARSQYDSGCFSNTLYALDTSTGSLMWWALTPPAASSTSGQLLQWPSARAYCSMAVDSLFGQLWLYGGAALLGGRWQYYSDLHVFDVVRVQWLPVTVVGSTPSGTYGMSLFFSSLYTNYQHLMLFGGCGGDNPAASNQLYHVQSNWQIQASNWLYQGNSTLFISAGQVATLYLSAVVSQLQPTPLLFALGLSSQWTVRWTILDVYGNPVLILPNVPQFADLNNGLYSTNFTIYQGRTAMMSFLYYEMLSGAYMPITPQAFYLTIAPGPFAAHTTTLLYTNYSVVAKSLPTSLTMQMHDVWNNPCLTSQGALQVSLYYIEAADATAVNKSRVSLDWVEQDNHDGTYTVTYMAPDADAYYLYVMINSLPIAGSPFQVTALDPLGTPSSIRTALLVVSVTFSAVVAAMMVALVCCRNNRVVRAGSPLFLLLICLGVIVSLVSVPVYAYPSNVSCRLFPFLLTTGYILALSALFTKSYRVRLIFVRQQLHSMALTDGAMMGLVFVLVSCETILNVVWLISDPLTLDTFQDTSVLTYRACGGPHAVAFIGASVAFNGLIAMWGVWLAFQIRHVPDAFGESKLMGAALYNLALVMAITIPLTWTASNTQSSHEDLIIPGAAILWCSFVTIGLVVAPKLYYIVYPPPQHFFDGYPTSGVMVKGVKDRSNGHGPTGGGGGDGNGKNSWSDERHEAAELAGFDVRRGGAPPPKKWRKHQGQPTAARRPGEDDTLEKGPVEGGRETGEVEMRTLKNSPSEQQAAAAVSASSSAAPAAMQPLIVEEAPAGFQGDHRRNSLSDRRRPAPIRTTVPIPPAPLLHHQSARSRERRPRAGNTLATPRTQGAAGKPHTASTGSADSGGATRLHSPAALQTMQPASSSPPSTHSQLATRYSPRQPTPTSQQRPSPPSQPSYHSRQYSSSVNDRSGGMVVT